MEFTVTDKGLKIVIVSDGAKAVLQEYHDDETIDTDSSMYEMFDDILGNTEFEWISPEEIGALTSAPIIGIKDENDVVIEAYGFMDYAIESLLGQLFKYGEALLIKG
jgi:hypothetical protein